MTSLPRQKVATWLDIISEKLIWVRLFLLFVGARDQNAKCKKQINKFKASSCHKRFQHHDQWEASPTFPILFRKKQLWKSQLHPCVQSNIFCSVLSEGGGVAVLPRNRFKNQTFLWRGIICCSLFTPPQQRMFLNVIL